MNTEAFEAGKKAYQNGDWLSAVTYLADAKEAGEASGAIDHMIGNAYMKLGQFDSAASAYAEALRDSSYGKVGALSVMALLGGLSSFLGTFFSLPSLMGSMGISLSRFPAAFVLTATAALLLMLVDAGVPFGDLDPSLPDDVLRLGPQRVMSAVAHGFLAGFPTSVLVQLWGERHGKPLHGAVYQAAVGIIVAFAVIVAELKLGADSTLWMLLYAAAFCVPFFCGLYLLYTTENEATLLPVILSGLLFSSFLSGVLTVGLLVIVGAFEALVRERMPNLDPARFGAVDLAAVCRNQIAELDRLRG